VVDTPLIAALRSRLKDQHRKLLDKVAAPAMTVAGQVLNAIKNEECYVFCDEKDARKMLERRYDKLLAVMNRQFPKGENA
jgi:hypothetical protein